MRFKFNKIRSQLQFFFFTLILLAVSLGGVSYSYIYQLNRYNALLQKVNDLVRLSPKISTAKKNFLTDDTKTFQFHKDRESTNLDDYNTHMSKTRDILGQLESEPLIVKLQAKDQVEEISTLFNQHNRLFMQLVDKMKRRGFKDAGLEGKMREAIHHLMAEDSLNQISLLTLRRHEKDFMLRKDLVYVDALKKEAEQLIKATRDSIDPKDREARFNLKVLEETIHIYIAQFDKIVELEEQIGLNEDSGLRGQLNETRADIDKKLAFIDSLIKEQVSIWTSQATYTIIGFVIFLFVLSVILAIYYSDVIARPVTQLNRVAQSVTKGLRNQEHVLDNVTKRHKNEIGNLAYNFKLMLTKLKAVIQQVSEKNRKLEEFAQNEKQRVWHSEGLAIFNEIVRDNNDNLEKLAFEVISELVKYTQSNQGGLFIIDREDEGDIFLELKGCYAYERKKYQKKRIDRGEGLIGTAWREEKTIIITDVPQDYVYISSGLGRANPSSLIIVPIKSNDQIEGVIELISFSEYDKANIEFIESLAQRIGSALVSIKANEKTKKLLKVSESIAHKAQEKESRLQGQLENYQYWVQQFENKLNDVSEEALIYQAIVGKVYSGIIITDDEFKITKVNNYVSQRFDYKKSELVGEPLNVLIDTSYDNILDFKDKQFDLNKKFNHNAISSLIDRRGTIYKVETISGKLTIDSRVVYVFLFNELDEGKKSQAERERKFKVAS